MEYDEINRRKRPYSKWQVVRQFHVPLGQLPSPELEATLADLGVTVLEYGAVNVGEDYTLREWFALRPK